MTTQEIREFAEAWIKKFYPNRKATHFEHAEWCGEDYCVYFTRAIDGYNDWHFTEEYMRNFTA